MKYRRERYHNLLLEKVEQNLNLFFTFRKSRAKYATTFIVS